MYLRVAFCSAEAVHRLLLLCMVRLLCTAAQSCSHLHYRRKAVLSQVVQSSGRQQVPRGSVGGLGNVLRVQALELAAQTLGQGSKPPVAQPAGSIVMSRVWTG